MSWPDAIMPNLTPEEQIAMRGRTVEWWTNVGAAWPKQITQSHWEHPPLPDPVEYVVYPVGAWSDGNQR